MPSRDLREFIEVLEKHGELVRVSALVDPELEITEITDRVTKSGGPALLFEKPKNSNIPLLINTFGTERRMKMALGISDYSEIENRIQKLLKPNIPSSLLEKLSMLPMLAELGAVPPKIVKSGPCQEVAETDRVNLFDFPILKCWPKDGGKYITFPMVITKDPETGDRNVGTYRIQVYDEKTTAMHWHWHKDGANHFAKHKKMHKRMEVAIALGADPITMYAATAPLPPQIDEFLLAGFLRKQPVELVKCKTIDLEVPAHAEIVLEGYIDPEEVRTEGPFGDHTGFYSAEGPFPVFHVKAITRRRDPIYPTIIVGQPVQEDYFLGKATERIFLPLVKMQLPEIVDWNFPAEGVFHNCLLVSIKKSYPAHARKVANAMWGLGQLMFTRLVVIVDENINVQNVSEVAFHVFNNTEPERDIFFTEGPVDILDHASQKLGYGSKMGVDATRKWKEEGATRGWPDLIEMNMETKEMVTRRWNEYGIEAPHFSRAR